MLSNIRFTKWMCLIWMLLFSSPLFAKEGISNINAFSGGTPSASSSGGGYTPEKLLEDNGGPAIYTGWSSAGVPAWWQYEFTESKRIGKLMFQAFNQGYPTAWQIQVSNDGSNWTTVDIQSGVSWSSGEYYTYEFTNNASASKYLRWYISSATYFPSGGTYTGGNYAEAYTYTLPTYTLSQNYLSSETISGEESDVVMWSGEVSTEDNINLTTKSMLCSASNSSTKNAISNLRLYVDVNGNNSKDTSDILLQTISTLSDTIVFSFDWDIDNTTKDLIVVADVDTTTLTEQDTITFSVESDSLEDSATSNDSGYIVESTTDTTISGKTITLRPMTYTASQNSLSAVSISSTTMNKTLMDLSLITTQAIDFSQLGLRLTTSGSDNIDNIVQNVRLVRDLDDDGNYDNTDVEITTISSLSSTSFSKAIDVEIDGEGRLLIVGDVDTESLSENFTLRFAFDPDNTTATYNTNAVSEETGDLSWSTTLTLYYTEQTYNITQNSLFDTNINEAETEFVTSHFMITPDADVTLMQLGFQYTDTSSASSAVSNVRVYLDENSNVQYDIGETLVGSLSTLSSSMSLSTSISISAEENKYFVMIADIDPVAISADGSFRFGVSPDSTILTYNGNAIASDVTTTQWSSSVTVYQKTYSYSMGYAYLSSDTISTVETDYPLLRGYVSTDDDLTGNQLTIYSTSTSVAINNVRIYDDVAKDGDYDEGIDTLIGTVGTLSSINTISLSDFTTSDETRYFIVVGDVDCSAITETDEITLTIQSDESLFVSTNTGVTATDTSSAIISGRTLTLNPMTYTAEQNTLSTVEFSETTLNVVLMDLTLSAFSGTTMSDLGLIITQSGNDDVDEIIQSVKIYHDTGDDGVVDGDETEILTIDSLDVSNLTETIELDIDSSARILVVGNVDADALTENFTIRFGFDPDNSTVSYNQNTILEDTGDTVSSTTITFSYTERAYSITQNSLFDTSVDTSETEFVTSSFIITPDADVTLMQLGFQYTDTSSASSVLSNVRVYLDENSNAQYDIGETLVGMLSNLSSMMSLNTDLNISANENVYFVMIADIDSTAISADGSFRFGVSPDSTILTYNGNAIASDVTTTQWSNSVTVYQKTYSYSMGYTYLSSDTISTAETDYTLLHGYINTDDDLTGSQLIIYSTSTSAAISTVRIYDDVGKDGIYDEGVDSLIGEIETLASTNTVSLSDFSADDESRYFIVVADIDCSAISEIETVALSIRGNESVFVSTDTGISATETADEVLSGRSLTIEPMLYSATQNTLNTIAFSQTTLNVTVMDLTLGNDTTMSLSQLGFDVTSSGDDDVDDVIQSIAVYYDPSDDGVYTGDETLLGEIESLDVSAVSLDVDLDVESEVGILVVANVYPENLTDDFTLRLAFDPDNSIMTYNDNTVSEQDGDAVWSTTITVYYTAYAYSLSQNNLSTTSIDETTEDTTLMSFIITPDTNATLSQLGFRLSEENDASDALGDLVIYLDENESGSHDLGETKVGTISSIAEIMTLTVDVGLGGDEDLYFVVVSAIDPTILSADASIRLGVDPEQTIITVNDTEIQAEDTSTQWSESITINEQFYYYTLDQIELSDISVQEDQDDMTAFAFSIEPSTESEVVSLMFRYSETDSAVSSGVISDVKLWEDVDASGSYSLGDEEITTFSTPRTIMNTTVNLTVSSDTNYIITHDVDVDSLTGNALARFGMELDGAVVMVGDAEADPQSSGTALGRLITFVAPEQYSTGEVVLATTYPESQSDISPETSYISNDFTLTVIQSDVASAIQWQSMTLTNTSSITDWHAYIDAINLYVDDNKNGTFDETQDTHIASISVDSVDDLSMSFEYDLDSSTHTDVETRFLVRVTTSDYSSYMGSDEYLQFKISATDIDVLDTEENRTPDVYGVSTIDGSELYFGASTLSDDEKNDDDRLALLAVLAGGSAIAATGGGADGISEGGMSDPWS
ncbi:MAG: discoidin domain-containing protein [Cytophagales bacterium]|nr:discoidin domain-containing protein [Cytophagales bacterium]